MFLGPWEVGSVYYDAGRAKNDPNKWAAACKLPGIKSLLGHFESEAPAKEKVEIAVHHWLSKLPSVRLGSIAETQSTKRTAEECFATAEAYESCADHLELEWTDDPLERKAGEQLQGELRDRAEHWRQIGRQKRTPNDARAGGAQRSALDKEK